MFLWAAALVITSIAGLVILRQAGAALERHETLERAQAIVILGGYAPFGAIEAASLFGAGWAPLVAVTHGEPSQEEKAYRRLGIVPPAEADYSQKVLEALGVPGHAIRRLETAVGNTAEEVSVIARSFEPTKGPVILVTSPLHSQRVRLLWNHLAGSIPDAVVRTIQSEPSDPTHWWRSTRDLEAVLHEWMGIGNVWLRIPIVSGR